MSRFFLLICPFFPVASHCVPIFTVPKKYVAEFPAEREADRVIKSISDEAAGAIKAEAEAPAAEDWGRVVVADGATAWVKHGLHVGTGCQGDSVSKPGCLVSFVGAGQVMAALFLSNR